MTGKKNEKETGADGVIAQNRKARHDYQILESVECGIALRGTEVKSCRMRSVSMQDSFAKAENEKHHGKTPQVMNHNRDSNSDDNSGHEPFQGEERAIDHMFGGTASYESKRQFKTIAREVLATVP